MTGKTTPPPSALRGDRYRPVGNFHGTSVLGDFQPFGFAGTPMHYFRGVPGRLNGEGAGDLKNFPGFFWCTVSCTLYLSFSFLAIVLWMMCMFSTRLPRTTRTNASLQLPHPWRDQKMHNARA